MISSRPHRLPLSWIGIPLMLAVIGTFASLPQPVAGQAKPDIVVVLTDDQPYHTLDNMPNVRSLLIDEGVRFNRYFTNVSICGASRATTLTGLYSHNHQVYGNEEGFLTLDWSNTLATWLDDAGYRTALIGKSQNNYDEVAPYVPPGWDVWKAFYQPRYSDFTLIENGVAKLYGPERYSTTVLTDHAVHFIEDTDAAKPLFLYFAPNAPHKPATPEPPDEGTAEGQRYRSPNYNEKDVSDKPTWVSNLPPLSPSEKAAIDDLYENHIESLQAVDQAVGALVEALRLSGRLDNTVIIFAGDNGYAFGAHRWEQKLCQYEECARVPLVIRAPGVAARVERKLASNVDLAPTILDFAGAAAGLTPNGKSLRPLMGDPTIPWRDAVLLENLAGGGSMRKGYFIRTEDYLYGEYLNGNRELYDLPADPFQLMNVVDRPQNASLVATLSERLADLRDD